MKIYQIIQRVCKQNIEVLICILLLIFILKQLSLFILLKNICYSFVPIFVGLVLAFFLQPLIDRLKRHMKTSVAVLLVYGGIIFLLLFLGLIFIPILYRQVVDFIQLIPEWLLKVEQWLTHYQIQVSILNQFQSLFEEQGYQVVVSSLQLFFNESTKYAIAFCTAFFVSLDLDFWKRNIRKIYKNYDWISKFYKTMSTIIFQYLIGTLIDLAFVGILCGVVLYMFQFDNVLLYALILALSNLFPYIGPTIGLIIVVVASFLTYENVPYMMFLSIWIIQQVESNVIQPWIFTKALDVRPVLTFVSLFLAEALFGFIGIVLSPIFASIIQIAFRSYLHTKTKNTVGCWEDIWYDFDDVMDEMKEYGQG